MDFKRSRPQMALSDTVLAKWPREVLDEGFCPYPKRLIRTAQRVLVGPNAMELLAVVLSVVDYKRPGLDRLPSLGFLAFTAGLDPETFRSRLQELRAQSLIEVRGDDEALDVTLFGLVRAVLNQSSGGNDNES